MIRIDVSGQRFGKLVAKYPSGKTKSGNTKWRCQCDCGREIDAEVNHLQTGHTKSCGKCSRARYDLTGQKFGRLKVIMRTKKTDATGNAFWLCECECGRVKEYDSYRLRRGLVKSCGCLRREKLDKRAYPNLVFDVQSSKIKTRNRSGVVGVSFEKVSQKWVARMMVDGKLVLNRKFDSFKEAAAARRLAEKKYLKGRKSRTNYYKIR
jgi:hypothetical protein